VKKRSKSASAIGTAAIAKGRKTYALPPTVNIIARIAARRAKCRWQRAARPESRLALFVRRGGFLPEVNAI